MVAHVTSRVQAGNIYVNRNVIGAVVGVQPFGGRGLSGTGPKAGGPLYLGRMVVSGHTPPVLRATRTDAAASALATWLDSIGETALAELIGATTTKTGLTVECALDERTYEKGIWIKQAVMKLLDIEGDTFHPDWNYKIKPRVPRQTVAVIVAGGLSVAVSKSALFLPRAF